MCVSKDELMEKIRIQHALAAVGYYAYGIKKSLGSNEIEIRARGYAPANDEKLMADDAKPLEDA
jgi:hypothetical protein